MNPFAKSHRASVAALGERKLIASIRSWLGAATPPSPFGIGDDCAVVPTRGATEWLVTTDPVVFGRHFDASLSPAAVAAKLLKRNLSDIASMGGTPRSAVISLALPQLTSLAWLRGFYRALGKLAQQHGVAIAGGDITESDATLGAFLTLIGAAGPRVLTRQGARSGDWIYVTGQLGGSILGHHWQFTPRLAEGRWLASRKEVRSLMDVSDGLAKDLVDLTPKDCRPALCAEAVPVSRAAQKLSRRTKRAPLEHALSDGEDFELVFTVDAKADRAAFEAAWRKQFSTRLTCLGRFFRSSETVIGAVPLQNFRGYEHLG